MIRLNYDKSLDSTFNNTGYYRTKINGNNCRGGELTEGKNLLWNRRQKDFHSFYNKYELKILEWRMDIFRTTNVYFRKLALNDGNIYVTGEIETNPLNNGLLVMGFDSQGIPLTDFGINGLMASEHTNRDDVGFDIALQEDGKILIVAGFSVGNAASEMAVMRILSEGIDTSTIELVPNTSIQIFPNPIHTSSLNLSLNLAIAGDINVDLIDITGRMCAQLMVNTYYEKGAHSITLPLPLTLSAGQYILTLTSAEYQYTQMLIVL